MKKMIVLAAVAAFCATPAGAAGNANSGFTVGDCISDGIYGNEPNMADGTSGGPAEQVHGSQAGNVLPTQSPGPFTNNPTDPENPLPGSSLGDYHQEFGGGAVPAICRLSQ